MQMENKDICSKCGGMCCKKSGCDYFVEDFEPITKEKILQSLATGNISIVATLKFYDNANGKINCSPFLYLRARNKQRDIIDLFSMKRECSMLTESGCKYSLEERPGGGVNLIPMENYGCTPLKDPVEEIKKWEEYQSLLSKIVKRYCGKTPTVKLKEDVENVFYQLLEKDFDGVSKIEIADILSNIKLLVYCFPEEYERALERHIDNTIKVKKLK